MQQLIHNTTSKEFRRVNYNDHLQLIFNVASKIPQSNISEALTLILSQQQ